MRRVVVCYGYGGFSCAIFVCCFMVCVFPLRFRCILIRISSELIDGWLCPLDEALSVMS